MLSFGVECATDIDRLRALLIAAFGGNGEADLVEVIRQSPNFIPELSLVAREDGDAIAHVLFSRITIRPLAKVIFINLLDGQDAHPTRKNQCVVGWASCPS